MNAVTAEDFAPYVSDASEAARLAAEHNQMAGHSAESPASAPAALPVIPIRTTSAVEARATELRGFDPTLSVDDARRVATAEAKYASASPQQQNAMHAADRDSAQDGHALASLDAVEPAASPFEYALPIAHDASPEARTLDLKIREDMHAAGIPAAMGTKLGELMDATGKELSEASSDELDTWEARNAQALREVWGPAFNQRLAQVRDFVRSLAEGRPALRQVLEHQPVLLGDWQTILQLERLMDYTARRGSAR